MSTKISGLTAYTTPIATDILPIVDITNSITKKITWANLFKSPTITGQLTVSNSTQTSGYLATLSAIQTSPNAGDTGDGGLSLSYGVSASSATNQLISRALNFSSYNSLTGGGAISNFRAINFFFDTASGTTTTTFDAIYLDSNTAAGTVTTGRGLTIAALQGTTKYGIYDAVGTNWVNNTGGTLNIGALTATTSCIATFTSTTGAVLFPRMTSTQRDALTALKGMQIYNTTTDKMQVYNGAWVDLH